MKGFIRVLDFPKEAIRVNQTFKVRLRISKDLKPSDVKLCYCHRYDWYRADKIQLEPDTKDNDSYIDYIATVFFNEAYVHYCCFELKLDGKQKYLKRNIETNEPYITDGEGYHWDLTVYERGFFTPDWAKGGTMYQIFVDRFSRKGSFFEPQEGRKYHSSWDEEIVWKPNKQGEYESMDFYGGNLRGIKSHLRYLKSIGVNILYLTPIMYSSSNHRYDTLDYQKIDPDVGDWEDLKDLCQKAKEMDMYIILDMVFSHTGRNAIYTKSPETLAWYERNGDKFNCWYGFDNLIIVNKNHPEYQEFVYGKNGVVDKCKKTGLKGLRLDVADDLTDQFIEGIKRSLGKENILYGEVWENAIKKEKDNKERTYLLGKGLDSVMNYPFMDSMIRYIRYGNNKYLEKTIKEILSDYPKDAVDVLMNFVGTHDTPRILNMLTGIGMKENKDKYAHVWDMERDGEWDQVGHFDTLQFRTWEYQNDKLSKENYKQAKKMLKVLAVMQFFLPGIPCIFYGDEVGIQGNKDPFNRKPYPWNKRDKNLLVFYKKLGKLRRKYKEILAEAELEIVKLDESVFIFKRKEQEDVLTIAINRTNRAQVVNIENKGEIVFNINKSDKKSLQPYGAIIIIESKEE